MNTDDINYDELDPGIRETVRWLRSLEFETTDSGDGVTKGADGWETPHVYMQTDSRHLLSDAHRLLFILNESRIEVAEVGSAAVQIQATYDPANMSAWLAVLGLDDAKLLASDALAVAAGAKEGQG